MTAARTSLTGSPESLHPRTLPRPADRADGDGDGTAAAREYDQFHGPDTARRRQGFDTGGVAGAGARAGPRPVRLEAPARAGAALRARGRAPKLPRRLPP